MTAGHPTVLWLPFPFHASAPRAELRALGRAASRTAFGLAAREWQSRHGRAAWLDAAIGHDARGAPLVEGHPDAPHVSIAHTAGLAGCAIAAPGCEPPGVDAEPVGAAASDAVRRLAEETGEAGLAWGDEHWPLRLWCAKEACVKAERVGADLLGRTLRVQHAGVLGPDGAQRVVVRTHRDRVLAVVTAVVGGHVRAWTA